MYETKAKGTSYSLRVGKKTTEVKAGCFVIEHVPTGKFIAGASKNVSADVELALNNLGPSMQALRQREDDLRVHEYSAKTVKQAQGILNEIQGSVEPKYLLLDDTQKKRRKRK